MLLSTASNGLLKLFVKTVHGSVMLETFWGPFLNHTASTILGLVSRGLVCIVIIHLVSCNNLQNSPLTDVISRVFEVCATTFVYGMFSHLA